MSERTARLVGKPEPREESDAELLARVAGGDIEALGKIYDRHHPSVLRFISRVSAHTADAEDVLHATFLTVAKIAGTYDGRVSCRPWLMGIAVRTMQQRRRGAARFARMLTGFARWSSGAHHDPRPVLEARGELDAVARALSEMSEAKRVVLLMAEVEGVPCEEIARALGIPIGTVWTRLHAARRELRGALAGGRK